MEVHAHTHPSTSSGHRRKWTHYLWEFLMLFLAVFCGFLAENQREHMVEKHRARQYAISLIEDLKADTAELNNTMVLNERQVKSAESLLAEFEKPASLRNDTVLQRQSVNLGRSRGYDPQLSTYLEVKNSGSLRYFPIQLIKMLNAYETDASNIQKVTNNTVELKTNMYGPFLHKMRNTRFLRSLDGEISYTGPVFLEKPDDKTIQEWYTYVYGFLKGSGYMLERLEAHKTQALVMIEWIRKKYHLSDKNGLEE